MTFAEQCHADHKARLARMGEPPRYQAKLPKPKAPVVVLRAIIPCYPVIPDDRPAPKLTVEQQKNLAVKDIQKAIADSFGLTREELISEQRSARIVRPRQIAMYLTMKRTPYGTVTVGRLFGNKDHTTVIHGCRRAKELLAFDSALRARVDAIEARLLA